MTKPLSVITIFSTSSYLHVKVQILQSQTHLPSLVPSLSSWTFPFPIPSSADAFISLYLFLHILFPPAASAFSYLLNPLLISVGPAQMSLQLCNLLFLPILFKKKWEWFHDILSLCLLPYSPIIFCTSIPSLPTLHIPYIYMAVSSLETGNILRTGNRSQHPFFTSPVHGTIQ